MRFRVVEAADGGLAVSVQTDAPVFYLTIEAQGVSGVFGDNGFTLLPDEERIVSFKSKGKDVSAQMLSAALRVQHLRSTYL